MKSIDKRKSVFNIIIIPALIILMAITGGLLAVFFPTDNGRGLSNQTGTDNAPDVGVIADDRITTFNYTGAPQVFKTTKAGGYIFEAWGAKGGSIPTYAVGLGGYSKGIISLAANETVYIFVGQASSASVSNGTTYNGGTGNHDARAGGGATDFRLTTSSDWKNVASLRSRILVAGGGGESNYTYGSNYSYGGGLTGGNGFPKNNAGATVTPAGGGTQTSGGYSMQSFYGNGGFGFGGGGAGGGGGYYGGGGGEGVGGGGGGSSFISGLAGCNAISAAGVHLNTPTHYSGKVFSEAVTIA